MPHLSFTPVSHPIGGINPSLVTAKADEALDRVVAANDDVPVWWDVVEAVEDVQLPPGDLRGRV